MRDFAASSLIGKQLITGPGWVVVKDALFISSLFPSFSIFFFFLSFFRSRRDFSFSLHFCVVKSLASLHNSPPENFTQRIPLSLLFFLLSFPDLFPSTCDSLVLHPAIFSFNSRSVRSLHSFWVASLVLSLCVFFASSSPSPSPFSPLAYLSFFLSLVSFYTLVSFLTFFTYVLPFSIDFLFFPARERCFFPPSVTDALTFRARSTGERARRYL